jgi:hypothetical protein
MEAFIGLVGSLIRITAFCALSAATASAQPPLTARELMETAFREKHRMALDKGEIVLINGPEEVTNTELNALMAMRVPADFTTTISELQRQASGAQTPDVLAIQEITASAPSPQVSQAFQGVSFDWNASATSSSGSSRWRAAGPCSSSSTGSSTSSPPMA